MNVFITGSRSGLGYQFAKALAKKGHIVYTGVKTKQEKKTLYEKIATEKVILFPYQYSLLSEIPMSFFEKNEIDVLFLHASIGEGGSILEIANTRLEENYQVNVFGNIKIIKTFLQYLVKTNRKGKIFITSSLAAFLPLPYLYSYTSTKLCLIDLAETLNLEAKYQNLPIKVSILLLGAYKTGFNQVMVQNKEKDNLIFLKKAKKMTLYQNLFFRLIEKKEMKSLVCKVVKNIEQKEPSFMITAPISQYLFIKIYRFFKILI